MSLFGNQIDTGFFFTYFTLGLDCVFEIPIAIWNFFPERVQFAMHRQHICNQEVEKNPQWYLHNNAWISHMGDVNIILHIDVEFIFFKSSKLSIQLLATASTYARIWNIPFSLVESMWLSKFACALKQANAVRRIFTLFHKHKWKRYRGPFNRSLEFNPKVQYWEKLGIGEHIVLYIDEEQDGIKFDFRSKTELGRYVGRTEFGFRVGDSCNLLFYLKNPKHILPEETWYKALDDLLSSYSDNWREPLFRFLDICKKLDQEHTNF